jgi:hypothetical protein
MHFNESYPWNQFVRRAMEMGLSRDCSWQTFTLVVYKNSLVWF